MKQMKAVECWDLESAYNFEVLYTIVQFPVEYWSPGLNVILDIFWGFLPNWTFPILGDTKMHSQEIKMYQRRFSFNWDRKWMHSEYDHYNDDEDCQKAMMMMIMMIMLRWVSQQIPNSQIPIGWESDIMFPP